MGNSAALFFEPFNHDPRNRGSLRHVMFPESQEGAAMTMTEEDHYTRFAPGNLEKLIKVAVRAGVPPHVHAIRVNPRQSAAVAILSRRSNPHRVTGDEKSQ